jgi:tetratricopeptide (TPR) repeat protein
MIVKNESKIILRLLESVTPLIDSYCICDTGSTDNTIEIIRKYCESREIPGKIMEEPFRDFGYNRTYALKGCNNMDCADYILLLDADMKLEINIANIEEFKKTLTKDAYYLIQGSPSFHNQNIRIIRNDPTYYYWGVTHEYIELPDDASLDKINSNVLFIDDIGDGGSKENKYHRDIELLKKGLETTPNNSRYLFYLSNSYRDSGQYELAIETYKRRIEVGGWIQETWHSYYSIGNIYMYIREYANAIYYWLEAYQFMPTRIENLYKIVNYYRCDKKYALALVFYDMAERVRIKNPPHNHLFLENDIYEHKLDYELSIIGYYTKLNKTNMINMCMNLLNKRNIQVSIYANIMSNYKYYCPKLSAYMIGKDALGPMYKSLHDALTNIGIERMQPELDMFPSTPSICMNPYNPNEICVCKRYVNYTINAHGHYVNKEKIITKNVFATLICQDDKWTITNEYMMDYNKEYDENYIGSEDIKLYHNGEYIEYTANRITPGCNFQVEYGSYNYLNNTNISSLILSMHKPQLYEKNWTLFQNHKDEQRIVYKWSPLTICQRMNDKINIINEINTPYLFKNLRGSTNGLHVGNEIWFLCHLVSHENRRYYYHMFVAINIETYQVIKYSQLFTFDNEPIEYSLGFIHVKKDDTFLIGYSTNDNKTKFMTINKCVIDEMFIMCP